MNVVAAERKTVRMFSRTVRESCKKIKREFLREVLRELFLEIFCAVIFEGNFAGIILEKCLPLQENPGLHLLFRKVAQ